MPEASHTAAEAQAETSVKREESTYPQILKSSALVGGSQLLNIAIGIVRTKAMAMLLGPAGFGLFGLYGSISDLTQSVAGMGVNSSGVRQIAEASASGKWERIAQTAAALRKASICLGLLGATFLVIFARQVSALTFGDARHVAAVSLLSIAVFLRLVSAGQGALLQGMRRIADLARMNVLSALFGTAIAIPVVFFFRDNGVVPSLIGVAAMMIVTSWWYSRKIHMPTPSAAISEVRREVAPLLKLGFAFMATGLMTLGSAYIVRIIVMRKLGIEATGFYQSAWTLGGLYISFILQAMGADFYPRLTASAHENTTCNRMVNEQARLGLLLAGPGAIATLTFAPVVIQLFYSAEFHAAIDVLRWICLGTTLQVVTWPMGFIALAKGRSNVFFWSDFAWTVVYLALAWYSVRWFGLKGAGIAFFGSYVFHAFVTYCIARSLSGFRWSRENSRTGLLALSVVTLVFCQLYLLPFEVAICLGTVVTVLAAGYSIRVLLTLMPSERISVVLRRIFPWLCPARG